MVQIGYYPGQPLPRPPKGKAIPPPEYDFDVVSKWVDQLDMDIQGLPKSIKENIIEDIKRQLTVTSSVKTTAYDSQRALEFGDIDETPSVQLKVSINPIDWLDDPGKQLKSFALSAKNSILNWSDFENYVDRKYFWEPIIAGRPELAPATKPGSILDPASKKLMGVEPGGENPFRLHGFFSYQYDPGNIATTDTSTYHLDAYGNYVVDSHDFFTNLSEVTAENFLKFQDHAESATLRNASYTNFNAAAVRTVAEELGNFAAISGSPIHEKAARHLKAADEVGQAMEAARDGLNDLSKTLSKYASGAEASPTAVEGAFRSFYSGGTGKIQRALDKLDHARSLITDPADLAVFDKKTAQFRNKLEKLSTFSDKTLSTRTLSDKGVVRELNGFVNTQRDTFLEPGFLKGRETRYYINTVESAIHRGITPFTAASERGVGLAMQDYTADKKARGEPSLVRNIQRTSKLARVTYNRNDVADFLKNAEDGKLLQVYGWKFVRTRLGGLYPAQRLGDIIKGTHGMLLNYDQDYKDAKILGIKFSAFLPANRFNVKIDGKNVSVIGGKHFQGAINLFNQATTNLDPLRTNRITADALRMVIDARGHIVGFTDGGATLIRFLNNPASIAVPISAKDAKALAKMVGAFGDFGEWLKTNPYARKLGLTFTATGDIDPDNPNNATIVAQVINQIGLRAKRNDFLNPLWEKVGYMQKAVELANRIQTRLFKIGGKFLAPFMKLRSAVYNAISNALITAFEGAITTLSGGALAFLTPVIEAIRPMVNFIIQAFAVKADQFVKAILRGELSEFLESMDKLTNAMVKMFLSVLILPLLILLFFSFMFFGTTLGSISPVDPTKTPGGYGGYGVHFSGFADCDSEAAGNDELDALPPSNNKIVQEAVKIARGLKQGFWCYWNRHPEYPNFWDQGTFDRDPFPDDSDPKTHTYNMFWCTYLVRESYANALNISNKELSEGATKMAIQTGYDVGLTFQDISHKAGWKFIKNEAPALRTVSIEEGDIIFFTDVKDKKQLTHVAIVHSIVIYAEDPAYPSSGRFGYIETIHSNSNLKVWRFDIIDGAVADNDYFYVIGFGRKI